MLKTVHRGRRVGALLTLTAVLLAAFAVSALAAGSTVGVKDNFYTVKRLTIRRGGRVTWRWQGALRHNVTVKRGPARFHSRTQVRGTFSHAFTRKGVYTLYCSIHPFMKMTVVVR